MDGRGCDPRGNHPGRLNLLAEGDIALWRRVRRRFYWLLTVMMLQLADLVPIAFGRRLCVGMARLAVRARPKDLHMAEGNLARAFPELDGRGRRRLLEESADALGLNLFDTLAAGRLLGNGHSVVEEPGPVAGMPQVGDVLADLAASGRGVFILTGHLGCWELLGGWLARELRARGLGGLGVVTGTVRNPPVDRLLQGRRRRLGMTVLPREAGAGPLIRYLRSGGIVAVLQDQNTRVQNLDIPFFGEPAPTPAGLARLAVRYRIPVLPVAIARDGQNNRHRVIHLPPLVFKEVGPMDEDVESFLTLCNVQLEHFIRRNPTEWVWFHKRWKS
ncbi:MAG: lysophospholipid acyltransferase family protein [Candidatus Krumholzibacteria bacterium]|nr:lysophospholipid acyltransferase family protein [Candidatus Krumholzibacteria bacterium]